MRYIFTVEHEEDGKVYDVEAPTLEMLQEKIGLFERHIAEGYRAVEPGIYLG